MPLGVGLAVGAGAEPGPSAKLVLPSGPSRVPGVESEVRAAHTGQPWAGCSSCSLHFHF